MTHDDILYVSFFLCVCVWIVQVSGVIWYGVGQVGVDDDAAETRKVEDVHCGGWTRPGAGTS